MHDSWHDIRPSAHSTSINIRRADPEHPIDWFRGKDHLGFYLFLFQGPVGDAGSLKLPKLAGIEISPVPLDRSEWGLSLKLLDSSQLDIFRALCANLMEATAAVERGNATAAASIVVARLRRWQELLRARRETILSLPERIGLFGELLLLRGIFQPQIGLPEAVKAWRGPHGDEQDFLFGSWLIEAKTQLSSADRKVRISSAEQLDSASGQLMLCHQTLGIGDPDTDAAETLNELVEDLRTQLEHSHPDAAELFGAKLIESGYERRDEYDADHWILAGQDFFTVAGDFPRIRPSLLPPAVCDVRYAIRLDACSEFRISSDEAIRRVFGR
ncbi:PD-(D/E)XK motif protein [Azospirillum brasilense]|nr:PD-(D/E)XK motif protein [Azospirillum brasilense]